MTETNKHINSLTFFNEKRPHRLENEGVASNIRNPHKLRNHFSDLEYQFEKQFLSKDYIKYIKHGKKTQK